jgi:hypothetical protein
MTRAVSLKDAYAFFLPLIFMAEMMMISHSIIHAFLARLPDPKVTLAAYNVAFSYHSVAGSPIWTAVMTSLAFLTDRRSVYRMLSFNLWLSGMVTLAGAVVAFTPVGDLLFGLLMGASPEVTRQAKKALAIFLVIPPVTVFRAVSYALLMHQRHTILITIGTFMRLLSLAGFLAVLPLFVRGASVGAAAMLLCITVEAILAVAVAWRFFLHLPESAERAPGYGEIWRFAWPLMLVQASENGVVFTINFFLGRLARPDLALAAFGVTDGLWKMILSPLRNLTQTAQTLVRTRAEIRLILRFTMQVTLGFAVLVGLFHLGAARAFLLDGVMGLTPELSAVIAPSLRLFSLLALVLGFSALFRGLLLRARITAQIARAAAVRIAVVVAVGMVALLQPDMNGAMLGLLALVGGFGSELLMLGYRLLQPIVEGPLGPPEGGERPAAGAVGTAAT